MSTGADDRVDRVLGVLSDRPAEVLDIDVGRRPQPEVGTRTVAYMRLCSSTRHITFLAGVSALLAGSVASTLPSVLAGTSTAAEWLLFVAGTVGGLALLLYGVDVVRGGHHFEVEPDVERTVG